MRYLLNDRDVVTIDRSASLRQAAEMMADRRIGSLLVVDDEGKALGIVTDRDLCIRAIAFDRDPDISTVERAMTSPLRTLAEASDPTARAAEIRRAAARRLPILNEDGEPSALVSTDDELRWISSVLSQLARTTHPGRFHGALRTPGALLDDLERHVDLSERVDESDGLSCATMMKAIQQLRAGLTPTSDGPHEHAPDQPPPVPPRRPATR